VIQLLTAKESSLRVLDVDFHDEPRMKEELHDSLWVDVSHPQPHEEQTVERILGLDLPSIEDMEEIFESSRLFTEGGALYLSAWVLNFDSAIPVNSTVSFIINEKHFVTIRYSDHHAFRIFQGTRKRIAPRKFLSTSHAMVELLEALVGHVASNLRMIEQDLNSLSVQIFAEQKAQKGAKVDLKKIVQRLGKRNSLVASLAESLVSFSTLIPFFMKNGAAWIKPELMDRLQTLVTDVESLREYANQLAAEVAFLLDSTVGLISIEQNQSMKMLSIVALLVAFI
jgi:magnesium transporter